ncbi:MAG: Gfo/Idh/MocA family oxidoreductase [Candidatus Hinthialibacter antarcticus]|nr:Gfo/Idh/MocA family oxidoreductase [Candidatus Hinthialibacter antarcticus]
MKNPLALSRRHFLSTAIAPLVVPARVLGADNTVAPSERITMGIIGMGTMGNGHLFGEAWTYLPDGYANRDDVQILAVCDVWETKRKQSRARLHNFYQQKFGRGNYTTCEDYNDFRDVLAREDIDAVLIATPIHWHAQMAIMAANAKKDIYCEKPTAVSIKESQAMVKAVKENGCIYQAGTQQRSEYDGKFRTTCELIRNGRVGKLQDIYAHRNGGGAIWTENHGDEQSVPEGFDWDLWLGPAPKMPYQGRYDAHLFGYGNINWGQHHYDIVQWSMDADRTGPIEISYDQDHAVYKYANGVTVHGCPYKGNPIGETGGGWYIGDKGMIGVDREHLTSMPKEIVSTPFGENDKPLYHTKGHSINFLECIKSRKQTICDAETAHRSVSVVLLGGIATQLKRTLKWDPAKEQFINDDEANKMLNMTHRTPWEF